MKKLGAVVIVAALVAGCSSSSTSSKTETTSHSSKPNVLFVLTDDLDLGEIAQMPHLKSMMVDQGVTFSDYYVVACRSAARPATTTLRGQYSHNTGVETNGGINGGFETAHRLGIESSTIGTWLHADGYRTALIGKYLNGYPTRVAQTYVPPGWDEWDSAVGRQPVLAVQLHAQRERHARALRQRAHRLRHRRLRRRRPQDFITKAAPDDKPFFAYLAVYAPHQPATPAPQGRQPLPRREGPADARLQRRSTSAGSRSSSRTCR